MLHLYETREHTKGTFELNQIGGVKVVRVGAANVNLKISWQIRRDYVFVLFLFFTFKDILKAVSFVEIISDQCASCVCVYVCAAFEDMLENPLNSTQWMNDPETGPVMLQISRIFQTLNRT